jgi:hypothetical protein
MSSAEKIKTEHMRAEPDHAAKPVYQELKSFDS